ncbi:MAG: M15 family metallopeptidase [Thermomonas sp.]
MSRMPPIPLKTVLVNTAEIEVWPASLLRARNNRDARAISQARHVLRRKRDGTYLAAELDAGLLPLIANLPREPGLEAALDALDVIPGHARFGLAHIGTLELHRLHEQLDALGLDEAAYAQRSGLDIVAEPDWLAFAGFDRYRRALWLRFDAARAWLRLHEAAMRDDVVLDAISGFRSHDYQLGIFERKLARGLTIDEILAVNAAPGFSEHHGGLALDIGAPDEPPAEENFEHTVAFNWLQANAGGHGFVMSYPRDNPHGIVYEPWHWCYQPA